MGIEIKKSPPVDQVMHPPQHPTQVPQHVIDAGILNLEFHQRLIADIDRIAARAGIPVSAMYSRLPDYMSAGEVEWIRDLRKSSDMGMVYSGNRKHPIEDTMISIAGACLRNYIDVRFMPVQQVIARLVAGNMPSPTVLLIPNFFIETGGDIAPWHVPELLGMLYTRMANNQKTILYVSSMAAMEKSYGDSFKNHLTAHYLKA